MFRPTDPQTSLLESQFVLPPAKRERLKKSWAEAFRTKILPAIDEEVFRDSFDEVTGRPNKSIRLLTGLHLLKEWHDLTDEQVIEQLEFNLLWHYALMVDPAEAHVCQKTLHNYRVRLMDNGRARTMFERVTQRLVETDGVQVTRQRLDSTHVMSNIAVLTRLGLFVETVTKFLRELKRLAPDKLAALKSGYTKRYLERSGYFADAKKAQARRRLPVVAQDVYALVQAFAADTEVSAWESYQLLVRLLDEQCEIVDEDDEDDNSGGTEGGGSGGPSIRLKEGKQISGDSLQSPHDPDATYGHKGKGYEAQIAETCVDDNPYQVVTAVEINGANESDQHATLPIVDDLDSRGLRPDELLADTAYGSGENIVQCAERGVELVAPVQDPDAPTQPDRWAEPVEAQPEQDEPADGRDNADNRDDEPAAEEPGEIARSAPLGLEDFSFNDTFSRLEKCPAGQSPQSQQVLPGLIQYKATFSESQCERCPMAERCPTRRTAAGERTLRWRDRQAATATRQKHQREPAFKDRYRLRSGVEATAGEFKGKHGAAKLRVRRRRRVQASLRMKAMAVNAKRAMRYHVELLRESAKNKPNPTVPVA